MERDYTWAKYGQHVGGYIATYCMHGSTRERTEFMRGLRTATMVNVSINCGD